MSPAGEMESARRSAGLGPQPRATRARVLFIGRRSCQLSAIYPTILRYAQKNKGGSTMIRSSRNYFEFWKYTSVVQQFQKEMTRRIRDSRADGRTESLTTWENVSAIFNEILAVELSNLSENALEQTEEKNLAG